MYELEANQIFYFLRTIKEYRISSRAWFAICSYCLELPSREFFPFHFIAPLLFMARRFAVPRAPGIFE